MQRTKNPRKEDLSEQIKKRVATKPEKKEPEGNFDCTISTGSTLLDLAISGGVHPGGGLPGGIVVEIFGPSGCGKSTLLYEIGRHVQRKNGKVRILDPEARMSLQFAASLGLDIDNIDYSRPDTISDLFTSLFEWEIDPEIINAFLPDSLTALSTKQEMESEDKMGMRRAKEFSEQFRKAARIIARKNILMVCSNQVRQNLDAGPYGNKWVTPGGQAVNFYSSVRLQCHNPEKIKRKKTIAGKEQTRIIGVTTDIHVIKNSVWSSYRHAPVTFIFDYGIDDIRENLQWLKTNSGTKTYVVKGDSLSNSLEDAIHIVEDENLQSKLRKEVIDLWMEIEEKFTVNRNRKLKM